MKKEKPWFQVNCKKHRDVTLTANQTNKPRNTNSFGSASQACVARAIATRNEEDKNRTKTTHGDKTEKVPLEPFFVVCLIYSEKLFGWKRSVEKKNRLHEL